ncbi:18452_t:CDS:2, partial [Dentiscutata erythropus]
ERYALGLRLNDVIKVAQLYFVLEDLPESHPKKIFVDSIDLSITIKDILYIFFNSNMNAPDKDLHKIFVFGIKL